MGKLSEWAQSQSKYIKLHGGESYQGEYKGYRESTYRGTPLIEYLIDDKIFSSGSKHLARVMDKIEKESVIKIIRQGEGLETKYEVEMVKSSFKNATEKAINEVNTKKEEKVVKPEDMEWS